MNYTARFKRREEGGYVAAFGRHPKVVNAIVEHQKQGWTITKGEGPKHITRGHMPKLADLKDDWARWAEREWEKRWGRATGMPRHVPTPPAPKGPPRHVPGPRVVQPYNPDAPVRDLTYEFATDPFDGRFKYPSDEPDVYKRRALTPLGVLVEVLAWLAPRDRPEGFAPVFESVRECVRREAPDQFEKMKKEGKA